jgi:hypothetical protein
MTMLNERNRAVLLAVIPKPFEEKPIECVPAHKRYKTEADAEALLAWEKLKSECVLLKGEK